MISTVNARWCKDWFNNSLLVCKRLFFIQSHQLKLLLTKLFRSVCNVICLRTHVIRHSNCFSSDYYPSRPFPMTTFFSWFLFSVTTLCFHLLLITLSHIYPMSFPAMTFPLMTLSCHSLFFPLTTLYCYHSRLRLLLFDITPFTMSDFLEITTCHVIIPFFLCRAVHGICCSDFWAGYGFELDWDHSLASGINWHHISWSWIWSWIWIRIWKWWVDQRIVWFLLRATVLW